MAVAAGLAAGADPARAGAGVTGAPPPILPADLKTVMAAVRAPGAGAVLVNVWATWCDPCREEMPALVRFYREHRAERLRLVLVSADEDEDRDKAARFLAEQGVDFPSWLKRDNDQRFIDGLDKRWSGALPASFLFDGEGRLRQFWAGEVTREVLDRALLAIVKADPKAKDVPNKKRRDP